MLAVSFASDPKVQGGAMGTAGCQAIVAGDVRGNPLVKLGFGEPPQIVFFRLSDLDVDRSGQLENPPKHGERGSHLP